MFGSEAGVPSTTRTVSQKKKRPAVRGDAVADDRAPRASKTVRTERAKVLWQALGLKN